MTTPYLTEERLRVLGFGGDLEDLDSAQIRNLIVAASAKVDSYCNVPRLPQPYSFRGGTITNEQQSWDPGDALNQPQRTIRLRHKPVKAVSSLRIYVTPTQYTDFEVDELFLGRDMGTIDIVSLAMTSSGLFGAFIVPNIGLNRPQVRITYTYGFEFTAVDEILEPTDAKLYRATNQFWDATAVEVKVNGAVVASSEYTVDRTEGTIEFDSGQAADSVVTASYGYTMPQEIGVATGLIAHDMLNEKALHDKGMGGLRSLTVGEIKIDRGFRWEGAGAKDGGIKIPADAEGYLAPWRFITVR